MSNKLYWVWGALVILLVAHADRKGWVLADSLLSGSWSRHGSGGGGFHAK